VAGARRGAAVVAGGAGAVVAGADDTVTCGTLMLGVGPLGVKGAAEPQADNPADNPIVMIASARERTRQVTVPPSSAICEKILTHHAIGTAGGIPWFRFAQI
jgi:hypothetical protein